MGFRSGRVLALLTGFDGGIISEYRGLGAWLAALSPSARVEIIERDPFGVVLYGDVQQFGPHEKRLLIRALKAEIERNPWLASYTSSESPLRFLVGPDLEDVLRQALTNPARDAGHQSFVLLMVEAIRDAAPLPALADPLMAIVRDDSRRPAIRCAALEAYIRVRQDDPRVSRPLRRLLDDVYTDVVVTQDDDLLGTLLAELYPDSLPVADLFGYLREPARRNLWTRYGRFWTDGLVEKSTVQQMVQLLDLLRVPMERVRAELGEYPRRVDLVLRPPVVLLRHLLASSPESVSREQLLHWLDFAGWLGQELRFSYGGVIGDAQFFREWLSDRADVQKAIVNDGVAKCLAQDHFFACMNRMKRSLFEASSPEDYGGWCADQALGAASETVAHWFVWEAAAFVYKAKGLGSRGREAIGRKLCDDARLTRLFEGRLAVLEEQGRLQEETPGTPQAHPMPNDGRFNELRGVFKENESALRRNECRASLLHTLAVAYFDGYSDVSGETPGERLQYLLGPDDDLVEAAMAGLRGTIRRSDLPTWTEVSTLAAKGRTHYLAYPFMAGLQELSETTETGDCQLDDSRTRLAVAIHFALPRMRQRDHSKRPPGWLHGCLARDPDAVGEVWSRCARARLGRGETYLPDIDRLARGTRVCTIGADDISASPEGLSGPLSVGTTADPEVPARGRHRERGQDAVAGVDRHQACLREHELRPESLLAHRGAARSAGCVWRSVGIVCSQETCAGSSDWWKWPPEPPSRMP